MEPVYIKSLKVVDFGGLEHFSAEIGQIAMIEGRNGAGKTTLLQAVQTVFEGGSDPAMIRVGADQAEVEIELTTGHVARKIIRHDGFDLTVKAPEGGIIRAPKKWLEELAPALSFDPIGFLASGPKDRADFLLQTLPLSFDAADVNKACGSVVVANGTIGLQRLNDLRELKYTERTNLNRQKRDLEGTINDMRKSLPHDDAENWATTRDRLAEEITQVREEIREKAAALELQASAALGELRTESQAKRAELVAAYNGEKARLVAALAMLEQEHRAELAEIDLDVATRTAQVNEVTAQQLAEETADLEAKRAALEAKHGEAKARADEQMRVAGMRQAIEQRKKALEGFITKEMELSKTIENLDRLKHQKLKELPVEGFDLKMDGKKPVITINGVPLDQLNRQQQIYVAIQFVQQSAGKMPLILCECAELDDEHMDILTEAAKDSGIQLIVARWDTGAPLQVKAA